MVKPIQEANVGSVNVRVGADGGPRLSSRGIARSRLTMVEIRYGLSAFATGDDMPTWDSAYTVGVRFQSEASEVCVNGKAFAVSAKAGDARLVYLPDVDYVDFNTPRHSLEILLPRHFLSELADDLEVPEVTRIGGTHYEMVRDPIIHRMARSVLPYLDAPDDLHPLFADHFIWGFGTYVCARYGDLAARRRVVGGLASWQERLAKEVIEANLGQRISLPDLAGLCGLRTSQFAHAFKRSVGVPPYEWLTQRRVERAKQFLSGRELSLAEVAQLSGFSDQSHLTRVFSRRVGATPGAWRLQRK